MWELDCEESWAPKNRCFWTVVLEKALESPLDCKEMKPVHPKGDQSWVFIGRTDAKVETPILWPPDAKSWLIWKEPDGWERLRAGGEADDRGWNGWMASPTQWTWVWVDSGSWLWTGRPGVLRFMGSQRIGHNWATELNSFFIYVCVYIYVYVYIYIYICLNGVKNEYHFRPLLSTPELTATKFNVYSAGLFCLVNI